MIEPKFSALVHWRHRPISTGTTCRAQPSGSGHADHRLLYSLPSYSREMAPLLWACGTCWLSAGSPSGYWGVTPTAQSLEETLQTPTFHLAEGISSDVQSVNIGIHSAWRNASDHTLWRRIVNTETLHQGTRHSRERVWLMFAGVLCCLMSKMVLSLLTDGVCCVYRATIHTCCYKVKIDCTWTQRKVCLSCQVSHDQTPRSCRQRHSLAINSGTWCICLTIISYTIGQSGWDSSYCT